MAGKLILALCFLAVGAGGRSAEPTTRTVVDVMGREVEVPTTIRRVVCTGSGALRLVVYAQALDLLVGVEDADKIARPERAYAYAEHKRFAALPAIGKGGGRAYTAYEEEILGLAPDVIITGYNAPAVNELARKTGIPVVAVTYTADVFVDPDLAASLRLVGDLLDRRQRSEAVIAFIDDKLADLAARTAGVPKADQPTVYHGALTFNGARGFGGTAANFPAFTAINANNIADRVGQPAAFVMDFESILIEDPDIVFVDPGNLHLVNEEYRKNPDFFASLRAVREGRVYAMIAHNNYSTNLEVALANTYHAGKIIHPDRFADIQPEAVLDECLEFFLGKRFASELAAAGLRYGEVTIGDR